MQMIASFQSILLPQHAKRTGQPKKLSAFSERKLRIAEILRQKKSLPKQNGEFNGCVRNIRMLAAAYHWHCGGALYKNRV